MDLSTVICSFIPVWKAQELCELFFIVCNAIGKAAIDCIRGRDGEVLFRIRQVDFAFERAVDSRWILSIGGILGAELAVCDHCLDEIPRVSIGFSDVPEFLDPCRQLGSADGGLSSEQRR